MTEKKGQLLVGEDGAEKNPYYYTKVLYTFIYILLGFANKFHNWHITCLEIPR
jgi:hypothetical protein